MSVTMADGLICQLYMTIVMAMIFKDISICVHPFEQHDTICSFSGECAKLSQSYMSRALLSCHVRYDEVSSNYRKLPDVWFIVFLLKLFY